MSHSLLVLSDSVVHNLLIGLSKDDILEFQRKLGNAITQVSVHQEHEYQPTPDFVNRPNGQKTLFRTFTSPDAVGTKIVVTPAPVKDSSGALTYPPLGGLLSLCDASGTPTGVLNAAEVTGYRTTLSALIPYMWRRNTENVLIFGAGKQGLWHSRLVLALRGSEIKKVTIVNRTVARARSLVKQVKEENEKYWKSTASLDVLDPAEAGYEQSLKALLSDADAVFCTIGSKSPIFKLEAILGDSKRNRLPFVSAIGSWQADMIEMDPEMLRYAAELPGSYSRHSDSTGSILVDDREEALVKSGEVIQSGLKQQQTTSIGEILRWLHEKPDELTEGSRQKLQSWISEGFIVFKGIGVSVTDLAAGNAILELAKAQNVGVRVPGF